ncbi:hypothetical protein ml_133 [Mollivirus sibericum]|uniref:hypothetical protein n=1 Tax=Mollivirus sibericum TaxID=1678078 RepID=UPI0006B2E0C8|nr:hypothetical protein ml_133 [Mollivirus sibericum]ALD61935.1 hypothetical protein ml_133 [Mollivirus sibericum]
MDTSFNDYTSSSSRAPRPVKQVSNSLKSPTARRRVILFAKHGLHSMERLLFEGATSGLWDRVYLHNIRWSDAAFERHLGKLGLGNWYPLSHRALADLVKDERPQGRRLVIIRSDKTGLAVNAILVGLLTGADKFNVDVFVLLASNDVNQHRSDTDWLQFDDNIQAALAKDGFIATDVGWLSDLARASMTKTKT